MSSVHPRPASGRPSTADQSRITARNRSDAQFCRPQPRSAVARRRRPRLDDAGDAAPPRRTSTPPPQLQQRRRRRDRRCGSQTTRCRRSSGPRPAPAAARTRPAPQLRSAVRRRSGPGRATPIRRRPDSSLTRVPTPLRDTPQTVNVVPQQVIQDQNASNVQDALRNVAGVTFRAGEGGNQGDTPYIRGFSAQNDMFRDGIRDPGWYTRDAFAIDAVEVYKGPSSVLFGRGSTGGAINLDLQAAAGPHLRRRHDHRQHRPGRARHGRRQRQDQRERLDAPRRHGTAVRHPGPRSCRGKPLGHRAVDEGQAQRPDHRDAELHLSARQQHSGLRHSVPVGRPGAFRAGRAGGPQHLVRHPQRPDRRTSSESTPTS